MTVINLCSTSLSNVNKEGFVPSATPMCPDASTQHIQHADSVSYQEGNNEMSLSSFESFLS